MTLIAGAYCTLIRGSGHPQPGHQAHQYSSAFINCDLVTKKLGIWDEQKSTAKNVM